jgi:hypothetical protein
MREAEVGKLLPVGRYKGHKGGARQSVVKKTISPKSATYCTLGIKGACTVVWTLGIQAVCYVSSLDQRHWGDVKIH